MEQKKEEFTLEHPKVQASRKSFERIRRSPRSTISLSFEEIFGLLKENQKNISQIGKEASVTRERMRQLYNSHFREFFADQTGMTHRSKVVRERFQKRVDAIEEIGTLARVFKEARNAGCILSHITCKNPASKYLLTKRILVNEHRCSVRRTSVQRQVGRCKRIYAMFFLSHSTISDCEFTLFCVEVSGFPERIFVVPNTLLLNAYFQPRKRKNTRVYIPLERKPVYNNRLPKIDWWQYENAWHPLQEKPAKPKPASSS